MNLSSNLSKFCKSDNYLNKYNLNHRENSILFFSISVIRRVTLKSISTFPSVQVCMKNAYWKVGFTVHAKGKTGLTQNLIRVCDQRYANIATHHAVNVLKKVQILINQ